MQNLERTAYRIRCITRFEYSYLETSSPIDALLSWSKDTDSSLIKGLLISCGITPALSFSKQGKYLNNRKEAKLIIEKIAKESIALKQWCLNPESKISDIKSYVDSNRSPSQYELEILKSEYVIEHITIPPADVVLSTISQLSDSNQRWYVCAYYESLGYVYYAPERSKIGLEVSWLSENERINAWHSKSEKEAIQMAKRISRAKEVNLYAFPRLLFKPAQI